jgi:hypothetical protein
VPVVLAVLATQFQLLREFVLGSLAGLTTQEIIARAQRIMTPGDGSVAIRAGCLREELEYYENRGVGLSRRSLRGSDLSLDDAAGYSPGEDATRDFAMGFREGRPFGPHPSEDNLSDEGQP